MKTKINKTWAKYHSKMIQCNNLHTVIGPIGPYEAWKFMHTDHRVTHVAVSYLDTISGDCIMCSDTDEVSIQTVPKKYQRRVRASCKLKKGNIWTEVQLKRSNDSCQDVWRHDHEIVRPEWKCALAEDHNSFEIGKMMSGLMNCSAWLRTQDPQFTPENQRLRLMTGQGTWNYH